MPGLDPGIRDLLSCYSRRDEGYFVNNAKAPFQSSGGGFF